MQTSDVPVKAVMCLDCGMISLSGDVEKARSLTREARET